MSSAPTELNHLSSNVNARGGESMLSKKCKAKTVAGSACQAAPMAGGLCFLHANPAKVRALGQSGGRKNRHRILESPVLPTEINARTVRDMLAQSIIDVQSNRLAPRVATALVQLSNSLMRVIQMTELEERVAKLEQAARPADGSGTSLDAEQETRTHSPQESELARSQHSVGESSDS
jgi:hypothetical protein